MVNLLRLVGLYVLGAAAYAGTVLVWIQLQTRPIDPNIGLAEGIGFLLYTAAFVVAVVAVPGILVPEPSASPYTRIAFGALLFGAVFEVPVVWMTDEPGLARLKSGLILGLIGSVPGIVVMLAATYSSQRRRT